jgi:hypothetical protein
MVLYQSFIIPLEFGFSMRPHSESILNCIDLMFLIDFMIMFFTSFRNKQGLEVFDLRHIAINYIKSFRFLIDFFSQLGGNQVSKYVNKTRAFGLLKMLRIFRLGSMIKQLNAHNIVKTLLNLGKLILYLILWVHFLTCWLYFNMI